MAKWAQHQQTKFLGQSRRQRVSLKRRKAGFVYHIDSYHERGFEHVLSGTLHFTYRGRDQSLGPGETVVFAPKSAYSLHVDSNCESLAVFNARPGCGLHLPSCYTLKADRKRDTVANQLIAAYKQKSPLHRELVLAIGDHLAALTYGSLMATAELGDPTEHCLDLAEALIDTHADQTIHLKELLSDLPLSYEHLSRQYRKKRGQTLSDFRRHCRIERACELLQDPTTSMTEIAIDLGYSSSQHFATDFKKMMDCSPSTWRNNQAPQTS